METETRNPYLVSTAWGRDAGRLRISVSSELPRSLLAFELRTIERAVCSAQRQKLRVVAALYDPPLLHDQDLIRMENGIPIHLDFFFFCIIFGVGSFFSFCLLSASLEVFYDSVQ